MELIPTICIEHIELFMTRFVDFGHEFARKGFIGILNLVAKRGKCSGQP